MRQLASAAEERDLGERVDDIDARLRSLIGTVAEHGAQLLGAPPPNRTWNWATLTDEQAATAMRQLRSWMAEILVRYPHVWKKLRPCWDQHTFAVDALTAAYGTWKLAMAPRTSAENFAWWLDKWLRALGDQLDQALGGCDRGHLSDKNDMAKLG
jgi:hypothetical protein